MSLRIYAVLPAAGLGTRMGDLTRSRSKVLLPLRDGLSVLQLTLKNIVDSGVFTGIAVAIREEDRADVARLLKDSSLEAVIVAGGDTRQESVFNALRALEGKADIVAVHDAARPFCRPERIKSVVERAVETGAAILAVPEACTLKRAAADGTIQETVSRERIWQAQTPQVFSYQLLYRAYSEGAESHVAATDESQLVERLGVKVTLVQGDPSNIKITTADDLSLAEAILTKDASDAVG